MKDIITICLVLGACLAIGDRPEAIALAAGMIAAAVILNITPKRRRTWTKRT